MHLQELKQIQKRIDTTIKELQNKKKEVQNINRELIKNKGKNKKEIEQKEKKRLK